jgi:hypothetical protein
VDVDADGNVLGVWEMFRGNGWENKGLEKFTATASGQSEIVTVDARALAKREFFEQRPKCKSFSISSCYTLAVTRASLRCSVNTANIMIDSMDC